MLQPDRALCSRGLDILPALARDLTSLGAVVPSEAQVPAEHDEGCRKRDPEDRMRTVLGAGGVEGQHGDERRGHDDGAKRGTALVEERVHNFFQRKQLALFVVGKVRLVLLDVAARMWNVRVDGFLVLDFVG